MGAYSQTEIGHGSDISGLETTATFDADTDEFIIHTPSIKATKWWPGSVGCYATHSVVMAKLIIDGNEFTVAPFIVQLRSLEDFSLLPGIKAGDMGPKMGYNSQNNGWCTFDHVRIPRNQMLMKHVSVDREGTFSVEGDLRALYTTMMDIRLQLMNHSSSMIARAVLIGLRYSAVRRQFKNTDGSKVETKLLDYQTQQEKLFPKFALAVAFMHGHSYTMTRYN